MIGILLPAIITLALVAGGWFGWEMIQPLLPIELPKIATLSGVGTLGMFLSLVNSFRNGGGIFNLIFWLLLGGSTGVLGDQLIGPTLIGRGIGPVLVVILGILGVVSRAKSQTGGRPMSQAVTQAAVNKALQAAGAPPGTSSVVQAMVKGPGGEQVDLSLLGQAGAVQKVRELMQQVGDSAKLIQVDRDTILTLLDRGVITSEQAMQLLHQTGLNMAAFVKPAAAATPAKVVDAASPEVPVVISDPFEEFHNKRKGGGR